jgi:hypothetical protein
MYVINGSCLTVDHHHGNIIAMFRRVVCNQFRWQVESELR